MTDRQKADTATALLKARLAVSTLETKTLADDASIIAPRDAVMDANGKLVSLQRSFNGSITSSPQYLESRSRLDAARSQIPRSR